MLDMKIAIETYFNDNWVISPISWEGMTFEQPADSKWIALTFTTVDRTQGGFGTGCATDTALLRVLSYGNTPNSSLALEGDVRSFIENYFTDILNVGTAEFDGIGIVDLDNGTFESSSLYTVISSH